MAVNNQSVSSVRTFKTVSPTPAPVLPPKPPRKLPHVSWRFKRSQLPWLLVSLLLLFSIFMFAEYHQARRKLSGTGQTKQVTDLVARVNKLIILPSNETPTVATVAHADRLRSQSFFANARDGDKLIIYNKNQQALLYRPATNQLVMVSTVSVAPSSNQAVNP